MAEQHEAMIRAFRRKAITGGLKEVESPMPTFRPDLFAQRVSNNGKVTDQVAVEAEINSTLFSEHTSHQLIKMDEFMRLQRSKRIRTRGFLLVPKNKEARSHARRVLDSLFPYGTEIKIIEAA